jgi:hypothetical protein
MAAFFSAGVLVSDLGIGLFDNGPFVHGFKFFPRTPSVWFGRVSKWGRVKVWHGMA